MLLAVIVTLGAALVASLALFAKEHSSSLFRYGQCQKQKEQQFLAALCGADEARTRDLRRDRPAF